VVRVEFPQIHAVELSASTTGVVHTRWRLLSQLPDATSIDDLMREGLPRHAAILGEVLGYRGAVFVALGGHLAEGQDQRHHFHPWIRRGPVEHTALRDEAFRAGLRREVRRAIGHAEFEPE
jgi:hypothetical protein